MWDVSNTVIRMTEGDYGIKLPIQINGIDISSTDSIKFTVKNGDRIVLEKIISDIRDNTVELSLSKTESMSLPVGSYTYSIDWYKDDSFLCNLIPSAMFKVVDKV